MLGMLLRLDRYRDRIPRDAQPLSDLALRHPLIQMKATNQSPLFQRDHATIVLC